MIELHCFKLKHSEEDGGLGQFGHFKNVVDMLWNRPDSPLNFSWNPWSVRMIEEACVNKNLAVAGCASSSKTMTYALWGMVNWLASPADTMVLMTSTSLKDARKRIWGNVSELWGAVPGLPGKLVDSAGLIRLEDGRDVYSDKCGIALIAGEKRREKEAVGKLIGFKNRRVILIADELPELSESILEAAYSNLSSNPQFQLIGIGNPASYYDAFGMFAKPKNGWKSISPVDEEWETERGKCIRFDGERSPNILAGKKIYPWMITEERLAELKEHLGDNSLAYWRMVRGFWSDTGGDDGIYSEADVVKFKGDQEVVWSKPPVKMAALDPAFTSGGDRSILYFGYFGISTAGVATLAYDHFEELFIDITKKDTPSAFQIADQFKERCLAEGVLPENAGYDSSGAGGPFGDVVDKQWTTEVNRVSFQGACSQLPVSSTDSTKSVDRYANKVTELWFSGREYLRSGQIRGICPELVREMCARLYSTDKTTSLKIRAESKKEMKQRIGKSPDIADAAFILLDLVRNRFKLESGGNPEDRARSKQRRIARARKLDVAGLSGHTLQR